MSFPEHFVWGAASASYQVEGAATADGKGLSVWDVFSHQDGKVFNGDTGDVACDHYHRSAGDVALMKSIGLQAYRLSVSWPRVLPGGVGAVNEVGLAFYDRLVDELLEANIQPYVTLFHWDFPYDLYRRGGWLNPDVVGWFADYTELMARALGDRVKHWMTLNEPAVFVGLGHDLGVHAPGLKLSRKDVFQIVHHVLLAHGRSVQALRAVCGDARVGYANNGTGAVPATDNPVDIEAARRAMFEVTGPDYWAHNVWADPMILGEYPEGWLEVLGPDAPSIGPDDMKTIRQPLDFIGENYYTAPVCHAGDGGAPVRVPEPVGRPYTMFHWTIMPEGLYWTPRFLYERYHLPIVITENGLSNPDWVALDGGVHDPQRIDYTRRHLLQLRKAGEDGVALGGYFHWSIMDNFEWAEGMKHRFGLIHVDYQTQKRTLKDSAHWYRDVIATHGAILDPEKA